jgi:predicted nucleic acid-binding Zn ribbon protein
MVTKASGCVKCGRVVEQRATGRPRRFCSVACKRSAEYERRRLDRRLAWMEEELVHIRDQNGRVWNRHTEAGLEREITVAEARLRDLLDEESALESHPVTPDAA